MERRDSKNSKSNLSKQKQKEKVAKSKSDDRGDVDERKGKGVGLVRTKPCREIYRPPSMRKGRQNSGGDPDNLSSPSNSFGNNANYNPSPVTRPTSNSRHCQFNVHAKEFQYVPNASPLSYSRSQPNPFYSSPPNEHYYQNDVKTPTILASSGCYPLQQSKSSGNVNNFYHLWAQQQQQQQQQQPINPQPMNKNRGGAHSSIIPETTPSALDTLDGQYFRLQQSKSSGNVPNGKFREQQQQRNGKTVRFDCDGQQKTQDMTGGHLASMDDRFARMQLDVDVTEKNFAPFPIEGHAMKNNQGLFGGSSGLQRNYQEGYSSPKMQAKFQRQQQLQKSQTTFYMPQLSSTSSGPEMDGMAPSSASLLKRSRSYTPKTSTTPTNSSVKMQQSNLAPIANSISLQMPMSISSVSNISASSDFHIRKWPKVIQELITTGVIGADRVPARHRIIMVGNIFNFLLSESDFDLVQEFKDDEPSNAKELTNESKEDGEEKKVDADLVNPSSKNTSETDQYSRTDHQDSVSTNPQELVASSVNIFLYFIQREKDRTVMETVLNTCFATFQKLQKMSFKPEEIVEQFPLEEQQQKNRGATVNRKWAIFLQFLSAMYTKMDLLFTIMTSIGRDMEGTFPPKMKQILAAVRDALLGIQPYSMGSVATEMSSPNVQKTLMQLIELHAANWHLPASAVRYYYSNPGSGY